MAASSRAIAIAALLLSIVEGACSSPPPLTIRDLARKPGIERPPVILIPGVLGSMLADRKTGQIAWITAPIALHLASDPDLRLPFPGSPEREDRYTSVALLTEVSLVAGLVTFPVYKPLIEAFAEAGYKIGDCEFPRADEDAFVFHYDFRRDGVETVKQLARAIERVRGTRKKPDTKIALVAHSFGALIARYYLMYGDKDVLSDPKAVPDGAGAANISHFVCLGAPHHGSLALLRFAVEGYGVGINHSIVSPRVIATCPSTYQCLPCPWEDCFLDGTPTQEEPQPYRDKGQIAINLYDPYTWVRFGWIKPEADDADGTDYERRRVRLERLLERGLAWWNALDRDWTPPAGLITLACGGSMTPTPAYAFVVSKDDGRSLQVGFDVPDWWHEGEHVPGRADPLVTAGDGRVTLSSALALRYARPFVGISEHDFVHQDPAVLNNALLFLIGDQLIKRDLH